MKKIGKKLYPYMLILPATILLCLFTVYPLINQIYLSMTSYNLLTEPKLIGLDNYLNLFSDSGFIQIVYNTIFFTVVSVIVTMVLAVALAVWLNKNTKINQFVKGAMFTPYIIALVSIAMVWMWMMDPDAGLFNFILKSLGLPTSTWLASSKTSMLSIIIVNVWKGLGYYMLVILAALQSIPSEIYEAAALDNSNKFRTFFKITLPMISPSLFFLIIIMTINSFKVFDTISVMTNGGPANSTNMLIYFIYQNANVYGNIGLASAASVIMMIITGLLTLLYFRSLSRRVYYQ